jgi:hypothetical protein
VPSLELGNLQGSGTVQSYLAGVSCTGAEYCVAVGGYDNGNVVQTLVEFWNGTKWVVAGSPDQGDAANYLSSVSCFASTSCVATGTADSQTLIESGSALTSKLQIMTASLPPGALKVTYAPTSLVASGGNPPYKKWAVVAGSLPLGLHLKKSTGVISGKPKRLGTYTFTVKVVDKTIKIKHHPATQNTATALLSITIS